MRIRISIIFLSNAIPLSLTSAFLVPRLQPIILTTTSSTTLKPQTLICRYADVTERQQEQEEESQEMIRQDTSPSSLAQPKLDGFDLDTALFCGGLAFDAYVEPPAHSTRWERGVS